MKLTQQLQQPLHLIEKPTTTELFDLYQPRPFNKAEVSVQKVSQPGVHNIAGIEHAVRYNFRIVESISEALYQRSKGIQALSRREADIAARGKIDLAAESSVYILLMDKDWLSLLSEGVVGHADNVWELRRRVNVGIEWIKKYLPDCNVSPELKEAASTRLELLFSMLAKLSLPAWPEERVTGFHVDLTIPEWMTHLQYEKARKNKVFIRGNVEAAKKED